MVVFDARGAVIVVAGSIVVAEIMWLSVDELTPEVEPYLGWYWKKMGLISLAACF